MGGSAEVGGHAGKSNGGDGKAETHAEHGNKSDGHNEFSGKAGQSLTEDEDAAENDGGFSTSDPVGYSSEEYFAEGESAPQSLHLPMTSGSSSKGMRK